jgi:tape measure domain-containing protein
MAAEIDPVILELHAKVDRYLGDVRRATKTVDQQLGLQERRVRDLEAQMQRSSGAIGSSLKGLAATFATAFTGRELVNIIDSYTRLQNSLKVTGLEGENLAAVQERLFAVAQKNGVELEAVGQLYSRAAQNQKELGASTSDLINLTSAVSASLRISGTSTQEASGALLQLGQALGSPRVQAEEFNSLLDTMQPLLREAAKNIEGTGGTLAGLTQRIKDTNGPGVSNVELFRAIIAALADLEKQAASSTLTISGAFTTLNNALTTYVGEAAEANGVTNALATGIQKLAENLDTVIPAITIIAGLVAGRFAIGLATAAVNAAALRVVSLGLAASLNGNAAAATLAGRSLLAAFGGPVGLAITALALGIGYVATRTEEGSVAAGTYRKAQDAAADASQKASDAADRLATATGRAREEALANAKTLREETKQKLASAQASLILATAEAARARSLAKRTAADPLVNADLRTGAVAKRATAGSARQAATNEAAARETVKSLEADLRKLNASINGVPGVANVAAPSSRGRGRSGAGASSGGLTDSDIRQTADKGRELGKSVTDALRRLDQDTQDKFDLATAANQNEQDLVRASLALATTRDERARLENRLLDLQASQSRAEQELVLSLLSSIEVQERIAQARLAILPQLEKQLRQETELANQSPGQRFLRDLTISGNNINDQVEGIAIDGLQNLNDQLVDAIFNAESLGDVFSNVAKSIVADLLRIAIQQAVIRPLAENLFGGGGGGGGGFLSFASSIASIFGRASGGPVAPGQVYRINEGASPGRVEGFVGPSTGGNIVPLGRMDAARSGGGQQISGTIRLDLSGDIDARIVSVSGPVAIEVVRNSAPTLIDGAANEALRRAGRPRL